MSLRIISYRLWRLRRLWAISVGLGAALVFWLVGPDAPFFGVFLAAAVGLPVLHVLRYPGAPHETLATPVSLALPMFFAGRIGALGWPPHRMTELLEVAIPVLFVILAICAFLVSAPLIGTLNVVGRRRKWKIEATDRSTARPEDLMPEMAISPERTVGHAICGPADEHGVFAVRSRFDVDKPLKGAPESDGSFDWSDDGTFDALFMARVIESRPDRHVVETWQDAVDMTSRTDILLKTEGQETRVTLSEDIHGMTVAQRLGFWLEDYAADALTESIDLAEGRPKRANRAFPRRQLVVDVSRALFPSLRRSAEDRAVPPH